MLFELPFKPTLRRFFRFSINVNVALGSYIDPVLKSLLRTYRIGKGVLCVHSCFPSATASSRELARDQCWLDKAPNASAAAYIVQPNSTLHGMFILIWA